MIQEFTHPGWSYSTNIYEVNLRQYTLEGTFKAFENHLPRLKDMGIEVLWFMPITPISNKGRKGTLGSYYAVENYEAINPEFGSITDFFQLIEAAHLLGFKIIVDWVANHSGNDNVWIEKHPEFYCYNESNQIINPNGWEDVSKLNYDNPNMRKAMINAMKFWVNTFNIDGFRCDMAHLVPLDFWIECRRELQLVKPGLFWLAECEEANYHYAFDATYTWKWMHKTEEFYKYNFGVQELFNILSDYNNSFSQTAFRVYFTSNHDENSWNGTEYEKYGDAAKALAVFSCTWNGIPMIYSGQEIPNEKRLQFFDKDFIDWNKPIELSGFYKKLLDLRKQNIALRAGDKTVITQKIDINNDNKIFAFSRTNASNEVLVILNFSNETKEFGLNEVSGKYLDIFSEEEIEFNFNESNNFILNKWDYKVFKKIISIN